MILLRTQKMLWGRAAARCAIADCRKELVHDATETDDPALIGENCHIVAESDGGPRSDPNLPPEQRNLYGNLVLLCRNHHKMIDSQENTYTVAALQKMKTEHEAWVKQTLGFDALKQQDDEQYAGMLDQWEALVDADHWLAWSSHVLAGDHPTVSAERDDSLYKLREWLLSRVWPNRYPAIDSAFRNFRLVLDDFQETFRSEAEHVFGGKHLRTRRFYKIDRWDPELYDSLLAKYEFHVAVVSDLMLELTRAGNLLCDRVRENLQRSYRLEPGRLVVQFGPTIEMEFKNLVVQYRDSERATPHPYPGLKQFLIDRADRDFAFGDGSEPRAP